MENNSCGFQISSSRDIDIEDDFGSRSSITSLLSSVGSGGAEPPGSGGLNPAFFESIAGYLDGMNQRAPLAEALLRKGQGPGPGAPGVEPPQLHMDSIISSSATVATNGEAVSMSAVAGYGGGGAVEQSSEQWQQSTSRGGGVGSGSGRMAAVDAAAATKVGKKRSRASRRAPTTVLTTDTSNFRAMVQEFTGIPPAPFASTPPFPRTRLDFLGPRNLPGAGGAAHPFLLRPFPQRMSVAAQSGGGGGFAPSTSSNFPTPPLFHSLLHPNLLNKTTPSPPPLSEAQVKAGLLEELGLNPPLLPDLVPSDRRSPQWSETAVACKMSYNKSAAAAVGGGGDLGRIRTLDLDDSIHNNTADPHHHHSNTPNNMRPDRMVDSWISSSDQTLDKLVQ